MDNNSSPQIKLPKEIGAIPHQGVTNGTEYKKENLSITEAARRAGATIPVPNADEIKLPQANQDLS